MCSINALSTDLARSVGSRREPLVEASDVSGWDLAQEF